MRIEVHTQTEEVAGGYSAKSAQPRRATSSFTARLSSFHTPHPKPPFFAFGTTGAPQEGLRCFPLSALSQTREMFLGTPLPKPRNTP
jgi:hypothetical protein